MTRPNLLPDGWEFLETPLFHLGGHAVTLVNLSAAALVLFITWGLSRLARRVIRHALERREVGDPGTRAVVLRLTHYLILLVGCGIALQTAGIDLTALFAAGAVFAVAIGFAMQSILQNFVAGVILLVERTIKPGDVLEVDGQRVQVTAMGIRTTVVRTLDDESLIVPNSLLSQSIVKNLTLRDSLNRVRARVGVSYASDMGRVKAALERAAAELASRDAGHEPRVLLVQFGESSVDWEVSVWTRDPWRYRLTLSDLNEAIWSALKEAGITIAFPQVDVHFDGPAEPARVPGKPTAPPS